MTIIKFLNRISLIVALLTFGFFQTGFSAAPESGADQVTITFGKQAIKTIYIVKGTKGNERDRVPAYGAGVGNKITRTYKLKKGGQLTITAIRKKSGNPVKGEEVITNNAKVYIVAGKLKSKQEEPESDFREVTITFGKQAIKTVYIVKGPPRGMVIDEVQAYGAGVGNSIDRTYKLRKGGKLTITAMREKSDKAITGEVEIREHSKVFIRAGKLKSEPTAILH